jgi:hypothetical protein
MIPLSFINYQRLSSPKERHSTVVPTRSASSTTLTTPQSTVPSSMWMTSASRCDILKIFLLKVSTVYDTLFLSRTILLDRVLSRLNLSLSQLQTLAKPQSSTLFILYPTSARLTTCVTPPLNFSSYQKNSFRKIQQSTVVPTKLSFSTIKTTRQSTVQFLR